MDHPDLRLHNKTSFRGVHTTVRSQSYSLLTVILTNLRAVQLLHTMNVMHIRVQQSNLVASFRVRNVGKCVAKENKCHETHRDLDEIA